MTACSPATRWWLLSLALASSLAGSAGPPPGQMIRIPAGTYVPLVRAATDAVGERVETFLLDARPVTNAEFLAFVTARPEWRRSAVGRLFADSSYLENWSADLEPGFRAPANA